MSNDLHRTGCGCAECGPPRVDPLEGDLVDSELVRARQKLARIDALITRAETSDPYNYVRAIRDIREVLRG